MLYYSKGQNPTTPLPYPSENSKSLKPPNTGAYMNTSRTRKIRDHKQLAVGDLILRHSGEIALVREAGTHSVWVYILNAEAFGDTYAPVNSVWLYNKWVRNQWRLICS